MTEGKTRTRMRVLAWLIVCMFLALMTRLWFLQVLAAPQFAELAQRNQVRLVYIQPLRGKILDRNGEILVDNRPSTIVLVDRTRLGGQEEQVIFRLSRVLDVPIEELVERLESRRYLPYQPIPVAEDVAEEDVFYIAEHSNLFPGVSYQLSSVRDYPEGTMAAHVLGYTGEISADQLEDEDYVNRGYNPGDVVGKAGVEAVYEKDLFGLSGTRKVQVNAQGRVLDENFGGRPPIPGKTLVLSIDSQVQKLAERSLTLGIDLARHTYDDFSNRTLKATGGAVVVMNPRNGQVLALASSPTYDPTMFLGGVNCKEAKSLDLGCVGDKEPPPPIHNLPLLDRSTQGVYPPGSALKPFVALGALRRGFATQDGHYDCPSKYEAPGDTSETVFHNWEKVNRGFISLPTSLVISCDTVYYQFGWDYWVRFYHSNRNAELMQQDLRGMGFGKGSGIDLPAESLGRVPDEQTKAQLVKQNPSVYGAYLGWLPGDYINMSIGQGDMLVTPIQMAVAYSALANGGTLWAPRLGLRIESPDGRHVEPIKPTRMGKFPVSKKHIAFIRNSLTGVTTGGTAAAAFVGFPLSSIPVAGKTGTADILPKQPYSWFAAMAPADNPKYVVVAMVEQGGHGSTTAAPLVRRILDGLFGLQPARKLEAGAVLD